MINCVDFNENLTPFIKTRLLTRASHGFIVKWL